MGVFEDLESSILSVNRLNDDGVPSASIAILDGLSGKISATVITKGIENTETVYQACSISKAITGLAVAKLVDQGRISYDTKVVDHVQEEILECIVEPDTNHLIQCVTVGYAGTLPTYKDIFSGTAPSNTPRIRFLSFPGSQYSYSGGGITLLQILLEEALQMPFSEIMEQTVLQPLGMTRSCYSDLSSEDRNYAKAYCTAYTLGTQVERGYFGFVELAAAGLWTTPTDLLKAVQAVQSSVYHIGGSDAFLSKDTAIKMLTSVNADDTTSGMAMGWRADDFFFAHSGDNDPGYTTYVCGTHGGIVNSDTLPISQDWKAKDGRIGIAIMTNSRLGFDTIQRLVAAIFFLQDQFQYPHLPPSLGSMTGIIPYQAPETSVVDGQWRHWIGEWSDGWKISDGEGTPHIGFGSISKPMRLRLAAYPRSPPTGNHETTFVIPSLAVAIRLMEDNGHIIIKLIQEKEKTLTRSGPS